MNLYLLHAEKMQKNSNQHLFILSSWKENSKTETLVWLSLQSSW